MSYLVHFVSVWASTYPTNLNRIVTLQKNVQLSNKQILFNTFDDSLPMQMPNSTQSKLCLLVLLQKKYLYTCKNIVTKPDLDEFLSKLFELFIVIFFVTYLLTNSFIYLYFYFVLCITAVNLFSIKKNTSEKIIRNGISKKPFNAHTDPVFKRLQTLKFTFFKLESSCILLK